MYNLRVRFAFAKRRQSPERGREWTGWTGPHLPLPSSGKLRKRWVFKCFFWDQLVTLWLRNSLITKKQKEQHKANMWKKSGRDRFPDLGGWKYLKLFLSLLWRAIKSRNLLNKSRPRYNYILIEIESKCLLPRIINLDRFANKQKTCPSLNPSAYATLSTHNCLWERRIHKERR